jgi:phosphohistidine phosphatase
MVRHQGEGHASMQLTLVHHGDAVGPDEDPRRPLSSVGRAEVDRLAGLVAARGVTPTLVWHSGKLRAKQTAEAFWRACNALAPLSASRDLQPGDPPAWMRDRLCAEAIAATGEGTSLLVAGHYPHLPRLLALLVTDTEKGSAVTFPLHGVVHLETTDGGNSWRERWRIESVGY